MTPTALEEAASRQPIVISCMSMAAVTVVIAILTMAFTVVMVFSVMIADRVFFIGQRSSNQLRHRLVGIPLDTRVESNARFRKRGLCPTTDAAANYRVCLTLLQEARQRSVAEALRTDNLRSRHCTVFHIIELELLRMAKMLKYLPILTQQR